MLDSRLVILYLSIKEFLVLENFTSPPTVEESESEAVPAVLLNLLEMDILVPRDAHV